jgi:hypothetical protein
MSRRCCAALAILMATAFVLPVSPAQATTSSRAAPAIRVLNDTALSGFGSGSAIGPDGALYVTNGTKGTLVRVDPATGSARVVGRGLPRKVIDIGGGMDVAFRGDTAFVLVSVAGVDVGGPDVVMGIYRLKRDGTFSVFADTGSWSAAHPPKDPDWFVPQGVQYSMEVWRQGFLIADAHHGRVLRVGRTGRIRELVAFGSTDRVPLGLEVAHGKVFLSTAGPIPHVPATSKLNRISPNGSVRVVGRWGSGYAGNRGLAIDVEHDRGRLYGLLQGHWNLDPTPENEGFPAARKTGEIVVVQPDGTFLTVVKGLDRPTSLELVDGVGYAVTITGKILRIAGY